MKKITSKAIITFLALLGFSFVGSLTLDYLILYQGLKLNLQYDFIHILVTSVIFLVISIVEFRLWLKFFPTPLGQTPEQHVWHVHVYQLFYLIIFNPIMKGWFLPIPVMRLLYLALGGRMDDNSYTGGIIYDAHLVKIGRNCILGESSLLTVHQFEGKKMGYYPIDIGNNVTIGAHAVILPGVIIEDDAIVASGSVVTKGSLIQKGEIWGGTPARRLKLNKSQLEIFASSQLSKNQQVLT